MWYTCSDGNSVPCKIWVSAKTGLDKCKFVHKNCLILPKTAKFFPNVLKNMPKIPKICRGFVQLQSSKSNSIVDMITNDLYKNKGLCLQLDLFFPINQSLKKKVSAAMDHL